MPVSIGKQNRQSIRKIATTMYGVALLLGAAACRGDAPPAATRVITLHVANGIVSGDDVVPAQPTGSVRVRQNDEIVLRWTVDEPTTVHLHGYELEMDVPAGAPTDLRFTARAAGRFVIEGHAGSNRADRPLVYLEVEPR